MKFLVFLLLSGCHFLPDYQKPKLDLPQDWTSKVSWAHTKCEKWWENLEDKILKALIDKAIKHNEELKIARARIEEVRGMRLASRSPFLPQVSLDTQAQKIKDPLFSTTGKGDKSVNYLQSNFDASYEFDLWGQHKKNAESADAAVQSEIEKQRFLKLSIIAEVALEYVNLLSLQKKIDLFRRTAETQENSFKLNRAKFKAGIASDLDSIQSEALYKTTKASIPELCRQLKETEFRISVLIGENPGLLSKRINFSRPIPSFPMRPLMQAPSLIIARRPDVRSVEADLISTNALSAAAAYDIFPKLSLQGLFGVQELSVMTGRQPIWTLGTSLSFPVFNFFQYDGMIKSANAREKQAYYTYKKTVLEALQDVETALSNYSHVCERYKAVLESLKSNEEALEISKVRFEKGISTFSDVLQAEQQVLQSRQDIVDVQAQEAQFIIALYKAVAWGI